jgi:hypothetical protein
MSQSTPPLPQAVGYGVVLGLGFFFALIMNGITWIQAKFSQYSPNSAIEFSSASRSVKTGLVVAGIISSCEFHRLSFVEVYDVNHGNRDMESDPSSKRNSILYYGHIWRLLVCCWRHVANSDILCRRE